MNHRAILVALACIFCQCTSTAASPGEAKRPPEAGPGEVVANVLLMDGSATVISKNEVKFPAAPGLPILRDDRIQVNQGGFVILKLMNGYLARLEEDLTHSVAELYMLDQPPATDSIDAQLKAMMTSKEYQERSRIAGWRVGLAGAETAPSQPSEVAKVVAALEEENANVEYKKKHKTSVATQEPPTETAPVKPKEERKADAADNLEPQPAQPEPPQKRASTKRPPTKHAESPGGSAHVSQTDSPSPTIPEQTVHVVPSTVEFGKDKSGLATWWVRAQGRETAQTSGQPALLATVIVDSAFLDCLKQALAKRPVASKTVKLMVKVVAGKVVKLALNGGLAVPACAKPFLEGRSIPEVKVDGWVIVEVELP